MDNHSFINDNETFRLRGEWIKLARNARAAAKLQREYEWFSFFKEVPCFPLVVPAEVSIHNGRSLITSDIEGESAHDLYLRGELTLADFVLICEKLLEFQQLPVQGSTELPEDLYDGKLARLGAADGARQRIAPILKKLPQGTYSHGDYHFGNLLLTTTGGVAAVDPGDYTVFDPRYDWAKLYHSLRGYNHTIEGLNHRRDLSFEEILFAHCPYERAEIEQLTGFLFLSMLPLHGTRNQRKLLARANEILDPYWDGYRVRLADYSTKHDIFVDFDGTLVSLERDFFDGTPNSELIEVLREYADAGKRITVYTARGMKSNGGDIAKITEIVKPRIEQWLAIHEVPYHELIIGKPLFDLLIDDNAKNIKDISTWIF